MEKAIKEGQIGEMAKAIAIETKGENSMKRLLLFLALFILACEGPMGPEGPTGPPGEQGPEGPACSVKEKIITIYNKNYTEGNPYWATVYFDDAKVDSNSVVVWIAFENPNELWVNIEALGNVYFSSIIWASGEYGYDGKSGYAVLIYDYYKDLLNKKNQNSIHPLISMYSGSSIGLPDTS